MLGRIDDLGRYLAYPLLALVLGLLTLPNLGAHALWDMDEGVNAEAGREMLETGDFIVPRFNYTLRTAKPVMLYWWQSASFAVFGVNEWAARVPSVFAALLSVLLTYELARMMFGRTAALLAGVVLASSVEFCLLAHSASPDSVLLFFTMGTMFAFWRGFRDGGRSWFVPASAFAAGAVLTKGPVGVALPGMIIVLTYAWTGRARELWDRGWLRGALVFLALALPWYILVATETHGEWTKKFLGTENLARFSRPMENHSGGFYYHALCLLVLFAPWSAFLVGSLVRGVKAARHGEPVPAERRDAYKFLLVWFGCYLAFFSAAATKLPNYVLPLYPAIAVLTARAVDRWRLGEMPTSRRAVVVSLLGLMLVGAGVGVGFTLASGAVPIPKLKHTFPGLEGWALLGALPIAGAAAAGVYYLRRERGRAVCWIAATSVLFVAGVAAFPTLVVDRAKAPKHLVAASGAGDTSRDLKLATLHWFHESLVFYAKREVHKFDDLAEARDFLAMPAEVILFMEEPVFEKHAVDFGYPLEVVARHYDFYKNVYVLAVKKGQAIDPPIPHLTRVNARVFP